MPISCYMYVLHVFGVFLYVHGLEVKKNLIVPFFSLLPQENTSQLTFFHVIFIASLQVKELT